MKFLRTVFLASCLTALLLGCMDHRLRPITPFVTRLKTVSNPATSIRFDYDANNRQISFNMPSGEIGLLSYDQQGRYQRLDYYSSSDRVVGEITLFQYPTGVSSFYASSNQSIFGQSSGIPNQIFEYRLDSQGKLVSTTSGRPTAFVYDNIRYEYAGDNIIRAVASSGSSGEIPHPTVTYEYDDKPNPYFGLLFPDENPYYSTSNHVLPEIVRQYSRNNITRITTVDNNVTTVVDLIYQYDSRGLPVSVTTRGGTPGTKIGGYVVVGQVTTFTYE